MLRLALPYSLACGVFLSILFGLSFYFGLNPFLDLSQLLFDVVVFGVFTLFVIQDKKQKNGGTLHFWEGMSLTMLVSIISTVVFMVLLTVYHQFDDQLVMNYREAATNFLEKEKEKYIQQFGIEGMNEQLKFINQITFGDLITRTGIKKFIAGLFLGPVITIILRTKPN